MISLNICPRVFLRSSILGLMILSFSALASIETEMPDFYSEPGINKFREQSSNEPVDAVDPFSGTLTISHTDMVVPGNGGLDIKIQRTYTSNIYSVEQPGSASSLYSRTPEGIGWTIHFGRIIYSDVSTTGLCSNSTTTAEVLNNPVLELPDGSKHALYVNNNATTFQSLYITKSQWLVDCITSGSTVTGMRVISPQGLIYTMDVILDRNADRPQMLYTSEIRDRNNNTITIAYQKDSSGNYRVSGFKNLLIDKITSSDSRQVTFTYKYMNVSGYHEDARLETVSSNSQTVHYTYVLAPGYSSQTTNIDDYYVLTKVVLPDNILEWNYEYYTTAGATDDTKADYRRIKKITYPNGATVSYDYEYKQYFTVLSGNSSAYQKAVVKSKQVDDKQNALITWTYNFVPSTSYGALDKTEIFFPDGKDVYYYYGFATQHNMQTPCTTGCEIWKTGLMQSKETYQRNPANNTYTLVKTVENIWRTSPNSISDEIFFQQPTEIQPICTGCPGVTIITGGYDERIFVPQLDSVVTKYGTSPSARTYTTTYSDYDPDHYQPRRIDEQGYDGSSTSQVTRTAQRTFFPRLAGQNIVGMVEDEMIGVASWNSTPVNRRIDRTYDANGNLKIENRYGVTTNYTYYPTGDMATKTDPRGNLWQYNNYKRGIPQNEIHPGTITVSRVVNSTGTVQSETNARGFTTTYTYDNLNRVKSIDLPRTISLPTTVNYYSDRREVTRGNYKQNIKYNGFGQPVCTVTTDTSTTTKVGVSVGYDDMGRKAFVANPKQASSNTLCSTVNLEKTSYQYDVLGRITKVTKQDGYTVDSSYSNQYNRVTVTDERNNPTTYHYRSYSNPESTNDRLLMKIESPENIDTVFERNIMGQATLVKQGNRTVPYSFVSRTYDYETTPNLFLDSETNPETGTTYYEYYADGALEYRTIGSSTHNDTTIHYIYDPWGRVTNVDYTNATTPDAVYTYDNNGNRETASNGISLWDYNYDENDNLIDETLSVDSVNRTVAYGRNVLDFVETITYPSGEVLNYLPDALGRSTQITGSSRTYVSDITYHLNGSPKDITLGNGRVVTVTQDSRLRPWQFTASQVMDKKYTYDPKGNVERIEDFIDASGEQAFTYDNVDRLLTKTGGVNKSFQYDKKGNIDYVTESKTFCISGNPLICPPESIVTETHAYDYVYNTSSNQLSGIVGTPGGKLLPYRQDRTYSYDGSGNTDKVTLSASGIDEYINTFDSANNLRQISNSTTVLAIIDYDANNMRVKHTRDVNSVNRTSNYLYATNGSLMGEYESTGRYKEYIYLGRKLLVERAVDPTNTAPVANAGGDQIGLTGDLITLDGTASTDTDGTISVYQWGQDSGPSTPYGPSLLNLANAQTSQASIDTTGVTPGTYFFNLHVVDEDGARGADTMRLTLLSATDPDVDGDGLIDTWEIGYFNNLDQGANDDPDQDGLTNLDEQTYGTDPTVSSMDGLTATQATLTSVELTWYASSTSGATYNIYWSNTPGVTTATGTKISGVVPPYMHTGLTTGLTYYYVYTADVLGFGETSPSTEVQVYLDATLLIPILHYQIGMTP